jgi:hypothetical protein
MLALRAVDPAGGDVLLLVAVCGNTANLVLAPGEHAPP